MRYFKSGRDQWSNPTQHRPADFGHGPIRSLIEDRPEGEPHPALGFVIFLGAIGMLAALYIMLPG